MLLINYSENDSRETYSQLRVWDRREKCLYEFLIEIFIQHSTFLFVLSIKLLFVFIIFLNYDLSLSFLIQCILLIV